MNAEVVYNNKTQSFRCTEYKDIKETLNTYGPYEIRGLMVRVYGPSGMHPEHLKDLLELNHHAVEKIAKEGQIWQ